MRTNKFYTGRALTLGERAAMKKALVFSQRFGNFESITIDDIVFKMVDGKIMVDWMIDKARQVAEARERDRAEGIRKKVESVLQYYNLLDCYSEMTVERVPLTIVAGKVEIAQDPWVGDK